MALNTGFGCQLVHMWNKNQDMRNLAQIVLRIGQKSNSLQCRQSLSTPGAQAFQTALKFQANTTHLLTCTCCCGKRDFVRPDAWRRKGLVPGLFQTVRRSRRPKVKTTSRIVRTEMSTPLPGPQGLSIPSTSLPLQATVDCMPSGLRCDPS